MIDFLAGVLGVICLCGLTIGAVLTLICVVCIELSFIIDKYYVIKRMIRKRG